MQTLLATIAAWLSFNFSLPALHEYPRIELVPPQAMQLIRHERVHGRSQALRDRAPEVEAFYDDAARTIYLAEGWTGQSPAELSVLVHEMVHHMQNVARLPYACPEEREKPAYAAQRQWLALFGRDLEVEFRLDPATLLVRTSCMH